MYLSLLGEKEKELFLGLSHHLSMADGDFGLEEQQMINTYCIEMNLDPSVLEKTRTIEDIILELTNISSTRERRIIVFEITGLAMADGKYDENERKLIRNVIDNFGLDLEYMNECEKIIDDYIEFQNKINEYVLG